MLALCITLNKEDKNRAQRAYHSIESLGFENIEFIPGIRGENISKEDIKLWLTPRAFYELNHGRYVHEAISSVNSIGCYLAHYGCWKRIAECQDGDYVAVFEDDFVLDENMVDYFFEAFDEALKRNVDILRLTPRYNKDIGKKDVPISKYLNRASRLESGAGYILSCNAAKLLVANSFPIDLQADHFMDFVASNEGLHHYSLSESLQKKDGAGDTFSQIHHPDIKMYRDGFSGNTVRRHSYCLVVLGVVLIILMAMFAKC